MRRPDRRAALSAAAIATAMLAPPVASAQAQDLIWARYGDIDSLDPHRATSTLSMQVWDQIYDTLLAFDMDGTPRPNMAASYEESEDGLSYTFTLNDGILCHDGSPFTSEDVKFTIDRAFDPDNASLTQTAWGPIETVEVIDDLTFRVDLESRFGAFIPFLADSFSSMVCDTVDPETFGSETAIGTGPFKLVEWVKGDTITLETNPDYVNWGRPLENDGPPHVDRLLIRTVPEAQTRLAALRTGEVHIAEPPFDDIRARQAVAYATDPEMAIDIIYGGLSQREWCPIARGVFGNDQEFCRQFGYEYDPDRAMELLAELGYGPDNPLQTTMYVWTGGNRHKLAEIFQAQLAQVGIDVAIEIMDIGTMNARVREQNESPDDPSPGTFDMMTWSWYDPDILYALWHSPGAYSGYNSPELDEMLELTRTTIDPEGRREAVHDVIQYLMENAIHVGLYTPGWEWIFALRPEVEGFKVGAFLHPMFQDVRLTE